MLTSIIHLLYFPRHIIIENYREQILFTNFIYKSLSNKSVDITVIISVLFEFIILQTSFPQINALFIKFNQ